MCGSSPCGDSGSAPTPNPTPTERVQPCVAPSSTGLPFPSDILEPTEIPPVGHGAHPDAVNPYRNKTFRIGDPGAWFDPSAMNDPVYGELKQKWATAGVRGGIPYLDQLLKENPRVTVRPGESIQDKINEAANKVTQPNGGFKGALVILENGQHTVNSTIRMKPYVYLVGESRTGAKAMLVLKGNVSRGAGFSFDGVSHSGIYRMTIEGSWGVPEFDWNQQRDPNTLLPVSDKFTTKTRKKYNGNEFNSVLFRSGSDNFLDKVNIYNSSNHPVSVNAKHITLRDLDVDGAHLKGGGAQGYFFIQNGYNLITGNKVTHLRHISMQGSNTEYNVMIDNDFRQEISYHVKDKGRNLTEYNRVIIPEDMPDAYLPMMSPWSTQHGLLDDSYNYLYRGYHRMDNYKNGAGLIGEKFFSVQGPKQQCSLHALVAEWYINITPKRDVPNYPGGLVWSDSRYVHLGPVMNVAKDLNHLVSFPHFDEQGNNYPTPTGETFYPVQLDPQP